MDLSLEEEQHSLSFWAQSCIKDGKLDEIIDPILRDELPIPSKSLEVFAEVARKCLQTHPNGRPTMADVVVSLEHALAEISSPSTPVQYNENIPLSKTPSTPVQYNDNIPPSKNWAEGKSTKVFRKINFVSSARSMDFLFRIYAGFLYFSSRSFLFSCRNISHYLLTSYVYVTGIEFSYYLKLFFLLFEYGSEDTLVAQLASSFR